MAIKGKVFNLSEKLPNVLLVGNGILTSCAKQNGLENKKWGEYIINLSEKEFNSEEKDILEKVPYSVQATVVTSTEDKARYEKYNKEFKTLDFENKQLLKDLVSLGFDAILTTNYTYEIEDCFYDKYSQLKNKNQYAKTIHRQSYKTTTDSKYLLHTYNKFDNSPPIWHIHGEERRKSSVILTHDEYSRLIHKLVEENKRNRNKYIDYANEVEYKSWLDYLLVSNLYIVGLGMDFSEFDLWWILNRRKREKGNTGKAVFFHEKYDEYGKNCIPYALSELGIKPKKFEIDITDKDSYFIELYKKATEYIKEELKG